MAQMSLAVDRIIDLALEEDLGAPCGVDVTTEAVVRPEDQARAALMAKQPMVVFGLQVFARVFARVDPAIAVTAKVADGSPVAAGTAVAEVRGPARGILTAERTALNLVMRLSGVATMARAVRASLKDYPGCRLLDTRKTTPGLRALEKAAVAAGGGTNHRVGLFDGVLIKDNHVAVAGGVAEAIRRARAGVHHLLKVECEVSTLAGVKEALQAGADVILLDNMDDATTGEAVKLIRQSGRSVFIEASGNMTVPRLPKVAALGVDGISMGALTHSAPSVDLSLEFTPEAAGRTG